MDIERSMRTAVGILERDFGPYYWHLGKGKVRANEPLYGAALYEPGKDEPFAVAESDESLTDAIFKLIDIASPRRTAANG